MDTTQIALSWLLAAIGFLAACVIGLFLWIVKSSERKVNTRMDQESDMNKKRIEASDASFQKGIKEAHENNVRLAGRLEETIMEMHKDQETSRKNCRDLVEAINKQISEKELNSLRTFAEKTELNALKTELNASKLEQSRMLERIHDKLDKLSEKLSST